MIYGDLTLDVRRKSFRRRISIVLKPGQPIRVNAALLTSIDTICDFIDSRREWIDKHMARFREAEAKLPVRQWKVGHALPFLGRELKLRPVLTPLAKVFASQEDEWLNIHLPMGEFHRREEDLTSMKPAVRDLYRRAAQRYLPARTRQWAEHAGLRPLSIRVREARARWGSCNPRGAISLNWRLMAYRPEVIDYVIVHELAHLRHLNHSKHFWALVGQILPDYKTLSRELKDQHRLSDFLER